MTDELSFLQAALPSCDRTTVPEAALREIVRHAAAVRAAVHWGSTIPEDLFLAYVLFPRVNTEAPSAYHAPLLAQLRDRIAGRSMEAAVQEINLWCAESAEYRATDDRTNAPSDMLRLTYGRCGEESVLLVSALRACCIPARQVYVPWWSHCDDNHAWVEAWVDGAWRYLGACEPEPVLDSGWFTAAASRAMLVHTKAWGIRPAGDEICGTQFGAFLVNRTAAYAKTALLTVRAEAGGRPISGLLVRFELANLAAFRPIHTARTDARGETRLTLGLGSLRVCITDGTRFLSRMVDLSADAVLRLDWSQASDQAEPEVFRQSPPPETRIQSAPLTPEAAARHASRLRSCAEALAQKRAAFSDDDPYLKKACGNAAVIRRFLNEAPFSDADKTALLETLAEKDFGDATEEMLADALSVALPYRSRWPEAVWRTGVLAPRVSHEKLRPIRRVLQEALRTDALQTAEALWTCLNARIRTDGEQDICIPDLSAVLRAGVCARQTLDVLFVACARTLGFAARLNPATRVKEVWDDGWKPLLPQTDETGTLRLEPPAGAKWTGGVDFGVERLETGLYTPLDLDGTVLSGPLELTLPAGAYRLLCMTRMADGSVDGRLTPFRIRAGETVGLSAVLPAQRLPEAGPPAELTEIQAAEGPVLASIAGRPALIALLAPSEEPSVHFLNELTAHAETANALGAALRILCLPGADADRIRPAAARFSDSRILTLPDAAAVLPWREAMHAGELRLPLALAVNRAGKGVFALTNYRVGSVRTLLEILRTEETP